MTYKEQLEPLTQSEYTWAANRAGYALAVEQQYQNFILKANQAADWLRDCIREPQLTNEATDLSVRQQLVDVIQTRIDELDAIAARG